MKLPIVIITTLYNLLTTATPNLCDPVLTDSAGAPYMDSIGQTLSRYCEWTGPAAPVWHANVCCTFEDDVATCSPTDRYGRCRTGAKRYCEHAERVSDGRVVCLQPLPDACEEGFCVKAPEVPPLVQATYGACCSGGGACQFVNEDNVFDCPDGLWVSCHFGVQNDDGTVDCFQ